MKKIFIFYILLFCLITNFVKAQDCIKINHILVDACGSQEGVNELFTFTTLNQINVNNITVIWPNNSFQGFIQNSTTTSKVLNFNTHIQNSGGCGSLLEPTNGVIPAGSKVVVFTSYLVNPINLFGALDENWYAIFQNQSNPNTSGHFANFSPDDNPLRTLRVNINGTSCSGIATYNRNLLPCSGSCSSWQDEIDGGSVNFDGAQPFYYVQGCDEPLFETRTVDAGNNIDACAGQTINLNGTSVGFDTFQWTSDIGTFGDATSLTSTFTIPSDFTSGTITLTLTGSRIACENNLDESDTVTITVAELSTPEFELVHLSCVSNVGSVTVTSPLGSGHEYSIDGGLTYQSSPVFNNVPQGDYQLTVRIGNCVSTPINFFINTFRVSASNHYADCFIETGSIRIFGSYLGPQYEYSIDGVNYVSYNEPYVYENLVVGETYTVYLRDIVNNCTVTQNITIIQILQPIATPTFEVIQPFCNSSGSIRVTSPLSHNLNSFSIDGGITYQYDPLFENLSDGTYQVIVKRGIQCFSDVVEIVLNSSETIDTPTVTTTQPTCDNPLGSITINPVANAYEYSINGIDYYPYHIFENLSSGTYQISVRSGGCISDTIEVIISDNLPNTPTPEANIIQPTCGNPFGSITITSPISVTQEFPPRFDYSIDGGVTYQYDLIFDNLPSGTYNVVVRDGESCVSEILVVELQPASEIPNVSIKEQCIDDVKYELFLDISDPDQYEYVWNTGDSTPSIEINQIGTYSVVVSKDGCSEEFFIDIDSIPCMIPRGISPNGDFMNDEFDLSGFGNISKVTIFNRYGTNVYSQSNYTSQWKGQAKNGNELPTGTYYYLIEFGNGTQKTGWVYLNREI